MTSKKVFQETSFTPSEVGSIATINTSVQRQWRYQGLLESTTGGKTWTKFTLSETASLLVRGRLAQSGLPPRISKGVADAAADHVLRWAQEERGAIAAGPYLRKGLRPIQSNQKSLKRYLVWSGHDGRYRTLQDDLNAFFSDLPVDISVAIVLDLKRLAKHLVTAAGRPLWSLAEHQQ